jgi:hypothetical protein
MRASDVMARHVVSIDPDASISEASQIMLSNGMSGFPLFADRGNLVGIVTEGEAFSYAVTRRYSTFGNVSNWWKGGGDGSVHSSVVAPMPQGLAGASLLRAKA